MQAMPVRLASSTVIPLRIWRDGSIGLFWVTGSIGIDPRKLTFFDHRRQVILSYIISTPFEECGEFDGPV